jgi:hypothetical protein
MKKLITLGLLVCFLSGCCATREIRDQVRDKHAILYVYVQRMSDPDIAKRPTPGQNEQMIKLTLKDFESLDKVLNNWKPNSAIPEVDPSGKPIK